MAKGIDVFLCYRRAGAQTAKLFKRYLEDQNSIASVWYSDDESSGNFKYDIPELIREAECVVIFLDNNFTDGFLEDGPMECITALEVVEIAKKALSDESFQIVPVCLDRGPVTLEEQQVLRTLFQSHSLDAQRCVELFSHSNFTSFNTARDNEWILFEKLKNQMLPPSFYEKQDNFGNFYFGRMATHADILLWDVDRGILPEDVTFDYSDEQPDLYRKIQRTHYAMPEIRQNNQMVSVLGLSCTLTDNEERKQVTIDYSVIDYKLFFKTLRLWSNSKLGIIRWINEYNSQNDTYEIPNAMGMAFFVVTKDGNLIFTRRSPERGIRPDEYDCSIVEGLKMEGVRTDGSEYDIDSEDYLEQEILRAYREEICSDDTDVTFRISGIVFDRNYGQWNVIGTIYPDATAEELFQRHAVRGDTFEKTVMEAVPILDRSGRKTLRPLGISMGRFMRKPMWSMALASLYAALRLEGFSDSDIAGMEIV